MRDTQQTDEAHLVGWLADRDATCPVCGYSLRNLPAAKCPECDAPLELAVASPNLNLAPWFVSVVALALGAGFDGVVSIIMTFFFITSPPKGRAAQIHVGVLIGTFLLMTAVCVALLVVGYKSRRKWAFWNRARQWWTAIAIFAATGVWHGIMGALLAWWMS